MCVCILEYHYVEGTKEGSRVAIVEVQYTVVLVLPYSTSSDQLNVHCRNSIACTHVELHYHHAGIPLTVLDGSPVAPVDYSMVEAVDHPTGGASMTPSRKGAKRRQSPGTCIDHNSRTYVSTLKHKYMTM